MINTDESAYGLTNLALRNKTLWECDKTFCILCKELKRILYKTKAKFLHVVADGRIAHECTQADVAYGLHWDQDRFLRQRLHKLR